MERPHPTPQAPVSWGELLDKITILEIKKARIKGSTPRGNVVRELELLRVIAGAALEEEEVAALMGRLKGINARLWDIEDAIREKESRRAFDERFVELARSVYRTNDERAEVKRAINLLLKSELIEEKSYVR